MISEDWPQRGHQFYKVTAKEKRNLVSYTKMLLAAGWANGSAPSLGAM
ncbi:MAG: hypothetical protein U1G07_09335 [Verrucomicrobiota bacterium]